QDRGALDERVLLHQLQRFGGLARIGRQEHQARRVGAGFGQREVDHGAQELVGYAYGDARAVTGVRLSAPGTAVVEAAHRGKTTLDDLMRSTTGHVHDEGDATRVMLVTRVVETLPGWLRGAHSDPPAVVQHVLMGRRRPGISLTGPVRTRS